MYNIYLILPIENLQQLMIYTRTYNTIKFVYNRKRRIFPGLYGRIIIMLLFMSPAHTPPIQILNAETRKPHWSGVAVRCLERT